MERNQNLEQLAVNAIRTLSIDAVQKANSGHPGMPLGAAPIAYELWANHMSHNPANPKWFNRDRFVLSAGHASMLEYSLLHLFGYGLTVDDIKEFRQWGSKTPGHPEYGHTEGVEMTTGPLGQGFASAVGMAIAEAHLAARFNTDDHKVVDHYTFVLTGDGCLMEGITSEASSLAGTLKLHKLIALYDRNKITIEGPTALAFEEDVAARYRAYGWQVIEVDDANDREAVGKAIEEAKADKEHPSMIIIKSHIGFGSPLEGSEKTHGAPLGEENIAKTKQALGWPEDLKPFEVPSEVYDYMSKVGDELRKNESAWNDTMKAWREANPELGEEFDRCINGTVPELELDPEFWDFEGRAATRKTSGKVLNLLAQKLPNVIGGSADLAPSNNTHLEGFESFGPDNYAGRNIHYGIREFAMAAIVNGMALHGGVRPFGATFLVFADYMKPALRLAALMTAPALFIFTHDSIGVGEDGPTHQPIEQLAMMRATPNLTVFRPADGKETAASYLYALRTSRPVAIVLTRQSLPTYDKTGKDALKGGYVLKDCEGEPELIIIASGSEVEPAMEAATNLTEAGHSIRVVSMPSIDVFERQSKEYQESVLPKKITKRIAIEAGATMPWYKFVGQDGVVIGLDRYGASAPGDRVFRELGINADKLELEAKLLLKK